MARRGLRLFDLCYPDQLAKKLREIADYHNFQLEHYYQQPTINCEQVLVELLQQAQVIQPMMVDVAKLLAEAQQQQLNVLFEGAQGALLDIDLGTYPFVTSSNTTAGAVATGAGLGPTFLSEVIGVTKAYLTRVGAGPFPTELFNEIGAVMADKGQEFGSTTGRPRRCGWFDVPAMRHSIQINGVTSLALMKVDVLDTLSEIKICTGYEYQGQTLLSMPLDPVVLEACTPIYETLPGWQSNTFGLTDIEQLPEACRAYIRRIEQLCGVPLSMISTGPERNQTVVTKPVFESLSSQ